MWFRKASPRRLAIREATEAGNAARRPAVPATPGSGNTFLIATVFFLVACAVQFWPSDPLLYREGELAPTDLSSPIMFTFPNTAQTALERENAREESPPVLVVDKAVSEQALWGLKDLKDSLKNVQTASQLPADLQSRFPHLSNDAIDWVHRIDPQDFDERMSSAWAIISHLAPVVSPEDSSALEAYSNDHPRYAARNSEVVLASADTLDAALSTENWPPTHTPLASVISKASLASANDEISKAAAETLPPSLAQTVTDYVINFINQKNATYRFSPKLTKALADKNAQSTPDAGIPIKENQVIAQAGKRISADQYAILVEARNHYQAQLAHDKPAAVWLSRLGRVLMALILTTAGALYITFMSQVPKQLKRLRIAWALCGLLLVTLVTAKLVVSLAPQTMYLMGISPTLITAIILVIAYNQRFALGVSALHGLFVTLTLGQNIDFFLTLLAGVAVFVFGLGEIRTRGKLIEVGVVSSAALFATVWAVGLARMGLAWTPWISVTDPQWVALQSLWAAAAGIVVAMLALTFLPPIERIFRITTSMTLLELCDLNKPLLQRLSQEAPGTFHHSLSVGILAEAAGNAIGANGLLCRVGAYYHDVGKLSKPLYFVENSNPGSPNRHDKLSPAMSLLIIVGHVKDGIELAREYVLPWVVHQFIGQHHGTTLVEYFYHAARKRAAQEEAKGTSPVAGQIISDTEFRYQGPKPQSRETAIVMICDGCESAVRSIEEPTQGRIEAAVHNLIMKRLLDGQFNECDLTLRELSIIEETLVRALAGVHHGRIAYPAPRSRDSEPPTLASPA